MQPLVSGSNSPCSLQPRWEKVGGVDQRSECGIQTWLSASCIRISYESLFQTGSISLPFVSSFPVDRRTTNLRPCTYVHTYPGARTSSSDLKSTASDDQILSLYLPSSSPQATGLLGKCLPGDCLGSALLVAGKLVHQPVAVSCGESFGAPRSSSGP